MGGGWEGGAVTRVPYILHAHDFGCTNSKTACYGPELMFQLDTHQAKIPRDHNEADYLAENDFYHSSSSQQPHKRRLEVTEV